MEKGGVGVPEPVYGGAEDLTHSSGVPLSFSYSPFSVRIPNDCVNLSQKRACPSAWGHDMNPHGLSCPLCLDLSDSGVSLCAPECYSGVYDEFLHPASASHTWTPGDHQYHMAERCDSDAGGTSGDQQIFYTLENREQQNQTHAGHGLQPTFYPLPPDEDTAGQNNNSIRSLSEKLKKPCHCTKSQCLKLYCDCFANGQMCSGCSCVNCFNNTEHKTERNGAMETCLARNPKAFRSKINSSVQGDTGGSHTRGCNCKSSGCLKNYCECYKAQIMCSSMCKCVSCNNSSRSEMEKTSSHSDHNNTHIGVSVVCITDAVVAATCGCLLVQAEEMLKRGQCGVQAERAALNEFGYCLSQIVHFMFKHTHQ